MPKCTTKHDFKKGVKVEDGIIIVFLAMAIRLCYLTLLDSDVTPPTPLTLISLPPRPFKPWKQANMTSIVIVCFIRRISLYC